MLHCLYFFTKISIFFTFLSHSDYILNGENEIESEEREMNVLKVSSKSSANSVAGALAAAIREDGAAEIQAIGAGAVNQSVKAIAIASGFLSPTGVEIFAQPAFEEIEIDGEERTAIRFKITSKSI